MKKKLAVFCILFYCIACNSVDTTHSITIPDPFDRSAMDSSVRPQEDFFLYANGGWLKKTEIPSSRSRWGLTYLMQDTVFARLHFLLDSVSVIANKTKNSPAQQAGDLYLSGMDTLFIEKKGWLPVKTELATIDSIQDVHGILAEIAREYKINHAPFFSFSVGADQRNSVINAADFEQGGLGMPTRDYYFNNDSSVQFIRNAYLQLITKLFSLAGEDSVKSGKDARSVMLIETALAKVSKSPTELRDPVANYHKLSVQSFSTLMPGADQLIREMSIPGDSVLVGQPEFYKGLSVLLNKSPLTDLKNYLRFHVLLDDAAYLSSDFVNANFAFQRTLTGQKSMRPRWERMITMVDERLGDALGQLYVEKYFPPQAKQRILDLVNNISDTYANRIKQLDWMSDSTKKKALVKLQAVVKKIGYPDKWKDYSSIEIVSDNLVTNLRNIAAFNYNRDIQKIGKPVDRLEWFMTPPTINAYYAAVQNNINFPAGILQPPFFYADGDDAINYGAIGVVIGHELTHGFDDQGRQFDADGNLKDWWTAEDAEKFRERAAMVVNQYNNYIVVDTFHINGRLTLGENIADCGGIAIAFAAFKKTNEGKSDSLINGFTPDQRFFLSLALILRSKSREERQRADVLDDPHSPDKFRANGPLSNMTGFYEAFQVKATDPMYRPDSIRVKIW